MNFCCKYNLNSLLFTIGANSGCFLCFLVENERLLLLEQVSNDRYKPPPKRFNPQKMVKLVSVRKPTNQPQFASLQRIPIDPIRIATKESEAKLKRQQTVTAMKNGKWNENFRNTEFIPLPADKNHLPPLTVKAFEQLIPYMAKRILKLADGATAELTKLVMNRLFNCYPYPVKMKNIKAQQFVDCKIFKEIKKGSGILDEENIINYWEKYNTLEFDSAVENIAQETPHMFRKFITRNRKKTIDSEKDINSSDDYTESNSEESESSDEENHLNDAQENENLFNSNKGKRKQVNGLHYIQNSLLS